MHVTSIHEVSKKEGKGKKTIQDYCLSLRNDEANFNAVIVADGMGSSYNSHVASEKIVQNLYDYLKNLSDVKDLDFKNIFLQISEKLSAVALEIDDQKEISNDSYGTTLICVVETETKLIAAYLGNGGIFHLKGNFTDFNPQIYYLPWCLINYLNPHTVAENGKEALYKYFSYKTTPTQVKPTIIEFTKDNDEYGDIIVICTDGVFSNDQLRVGKDGNQIWVEGKTSIALLIEELRAFFKNKSIDASSELKFTLDRYLERLNETEGEMTDDCSIGIIITKQVFNYQEKF